jgi:myo-inositol 2-dehydrogenase/D-chiro-inositol 1-dehydrogenase
MPTSVGPPAHQQPAPGTRPSARAAPVRVGLIGVGRIGRLHAALLSRQVPGAAVAAVCDVDPRAAAAAGAELGVPVAAGVEELLGDPAVDAVAICSATDTHARLIEAAAGAGKPTFCEKPVSLDLGALDRALDAVAHAGIPLQVGFNRRFDPAHRAVRDAVADGTVGEPHLVRISSRDPSPPPLEYARASGGLFLDMTIHDFDMARFVTGSEVVEVFARGTRRIEPEYAAFGDVDTALVTLTHASGCLTAIDNSRRAAYGYDQRVEVFGSRGMAASDNAPVHTAVVHTAEGSSLPGIAHFFVDRYTASYVHQWAAFVQAVRDGAPPAVTGADGRAPLVIGLAARRSLAEGRPVRVADVARA